MEVPQNQKTPERGYRTNKWVLSWAIFDVTTQRLQSSSFLVMTSFLLKDTNVQPKKELHWSPWVGIKKAAQ